MATRPSMQARDSSGRRVSLLNDESTSQKHQLPIRSSYSPYEQPHMARSNSSTSARSSTSSPHTPGLIRADSFDSNLHDPLSPITPTLIAEFGRHNSYTSPSYKDQSHYDYQREKFEDYPTGQYAVRHSYADPQQSSYEYVEPRLYDEESYQNPNVPERGPKRYPCRYRESHGCEKTFTTSGHASRHSKIHTAEKAVSCTWPGCQKKFTRADNMKQHLETHNKERSRSSGAPKAGLKTLTIPAGIKKPTSLAGRTSRPSSRNSMLMTPEQPPVDPALLYQTGAYPSATQQASYSLPSPTTGTGIYRQPSLSLPHLNRPLGSRPENEQSGLDALAIAADFQSHS